MRIHEPLEARHGRRVARVQVRVALLREAAERALDVGLTGIVGDLQRAVMVPSSCCAAVVASRAPTVAWRRACRGGGAERQGCGCSIHLAAMAYGAECQGLQVLYTLAAMAFTVQCCATGLSVQSQQHVGYPCLYEQPGIRPPALPDLHAPGLSSGM